MAFLEPKPKIVVHLVIQDPGQWCHETAAVVYPSSFEINQTTFQVTIKAPLSQYPEFMHPKPPKVRSTLDRIKDAVNVGPWYPIMEWADWVEDDGGNPDLVLGLRWLIHHRRFPCTAVNNKLQQVFYWLDAFWGGYIVPYAPQAALPHAVAVQLSYHTRATPGGPVSDLTTICVAMESWGSIFEAFSAAAIAVAKKRFSLEFGNQLFDLKAGDPIYRRGELPLEQA